MIKYPKQNRSDTLEESTVTQYIQGWANRTLYSVFLINWRLTARLLCSTPLFSTLLSLAVCFEYCQPYSYVIFSSRADMRSLLSRQCDPGSNPGVDAICELSLLLVLSFPPRGFSRTKGKFPGEHHVVWISRYRRRLEAMGTCYAT